MSYPSFEAEWIANKRVDTDGVPAGKVYQCVDLTKQYMHEEFGLPYGSYGNAIDYWNHTAPLILTKFTKAPDKIPQQGDMVVLTSPITPDGHIGIATGAANQFGVEILEQNGGTGNGKGLGGDVIRKNFVERSRIVGLLRPKENTMAGAYNQENANLALSKAWRQTTGVDPTAQQANKWLPLMVKDANYTDDMLNDALATAEGNAYQYKAKHYDATLTELETTRVALLASQARVKELEDQIATSPGSSADITYIKDKLDEHFK